MAPEAEQEASQRKGLLFYAGAKMVTNSRKQLMGMEMSDGASQKQRASLCGGSAPALSSEIWEILQEKAPEDNWNLLLLLWPDTLRKLLAVL